MRCHFGWKFHFDIHSALYLCSHELRRNKIPVAMDFISVILTEIKFQIIMRLSCEENLPEAKWINKGLLGISFTRHVRLKLIADAISSWSFWTCFDKWKFILGDKISCKHYPKWNAYSCLSKYWFDMQPKWNMM